MSIGWFDNLNNCLARCETRGDIGDDDYKMYEAAIPAMAEEFVREGRCSYAFMRSIGLPCPGLDPDGKSDKSQQCIILTSEGQKTRVLARLETVKQQNKERDELKERKAARLEQKAAAGSKRKTMSIAARKQLRAESKAQPLVPNDSKCLLCDSKWSVLKNHSNEYKLQMEQCRHCKEYICNLCLPTTETFLRGHQMFCSIWTMGIAAAKEKATQRQAQQQEAAEKQAEEEQMEIEEDERDDTLEDD